MCLEKNSVAELDIDFEKAHIERRNYEKRLKSLCSESSVYIFGAGVYARELNGYLKRNEIPVKGFVVDDEYADDDTIPLSQMKNAKEYILVYGMGDGFSEAHFKTIERLKTIIDDSSELFVLDDYWMDGTGRFLGIFEEEYLKQHFEELNRVYNALADDYSRTIMKEYLYAGVSYNASKLAELWSDKKHDYELDLLFSEDNGGAVIECGAFDGTSIMQINDYIHGQNEIIALECNKDTYRICCSNLADFDNVKVLQLGAWSKKCKLHLVERGSASYVEEIEIDNSENDDIEVTDLDSLIGDKLVSAILMDIEGSELKALQGAERILSKGPNLAIRIYHKQEDLITILQYISSLNSRYKYYIRYNHCAGWSRTGMETTLYAING